MKQLKRIQNILNKIELKQVIVVRTDLSMGKGKLAAQVAHAAVSAAGKSPHKRAWLMQGQKKTVVKCAGLAELKQLRDEAKNAHLPYAFIEDAGLTQLPPGTATCLGVGPAPEDLVDEITGHLKLL